MTKKKVTIVRAHPMHVPVSEKNPKGMTIRDQHLRRFLGSYLKREEILEIFKNHDRKGIRWLMYKAKRAKSCLRLHIF